MSQNMYSYIQDIDLALQRDRLVTFYCCDETLTKSNLGEAKIYLTLQPIVHHREAKAGT